VNSVLHKKKDADTMKLYRLNGKKIALRNVLLEMTAGCL